MQRAFNEVETALSAEGLVATHEAILCQCLTESRQALELEEVHYQVGSRDLHNATQQRLAAYAESIALL